MPILKLLPFLTAKDRKQEWSFNTATPTSTSSPVLGPLRKREYQTRQQQIRQGTPRRIGCPTRSPDEFPIYEHRTISPVSPEISTTSNSRPVSRSSSHIRGSGGGSRISTSPTYTSVCSQDTSSSTSPSIAFSSSSPNANSSPDMAPLDSDMDWTAVPPSSYQRDSSTSSLSSFSLTSGSCGKGFVRMGCRGSNVSIMSSLTNSHLSVAQLGGVGRRMSSPSISTTKFSSCRESFEADPNLSSSTSSCRNASMTPRPTHALSTSRTWVSSMSSSSSMYSADDENGYCSDEKPSPTSPPPIRHAGTNRLTEYVSSRVPTIITEHEYNVVGYDKVFTTTWLNSEEVLMGTKCNKLIVLNVRTSKSVNLGRMEECLDGNLSKVLSQLSELAAEQEKDSLLGSLGKQAVKSVEPPRPISSGIGITSSLERGLRFLNSGRRSSTPSFTTTLPNQSVVNNTMGLFLASQNFNNRNSNATPNATIAIPTTATNFSNSINTITNTNMNANFSVGMMHSMTAATSAGVRSLSINPSRTLLAIGAGEPFQVTIYSIPEYEPVGIMYGHNDLVFSLTWVSDTVLVTGSRDGSMRVWSMDSSVMTILPSVIAPIEVRFPILSRNEKKAKVRDLSLNKGTGQLMTLTTDGYVKLWNRENYIQISELKLVRPTETVCLTSNPDANLFAVGSQSHITIVDPRIPCLVHETESCDEGWGVRALDFKSHIITTGGGFGRIGYYDLRAQRYLDGFDNGRSTRRYQEIGAGWLNRDTDYADSVTGIMIRNAVYSLQYDSTGTRLFAAGGPLQLGLCGSYAGLWS
ncbi:DDB1- and CUL4-associated factor 12 [Linnemannia zychae]|nr:DDB1- and CUL4-associated factor 12 [Linnemannia zychae]